MSTRQVLDILHLRQARSSALISSNTTQYVTLDMTAMLAAKLAKELIGRMLEASRERMI